MSNDLTAVSNMAAYTMQDVNSRAVLHVVVNGYHVVISMTKAE